MNSPAQETTWDDASSVDRALEECLARAESGGMPLDEALRKLGPASFCFVCLLLSVPFIQPVSLGPFTMASGLTFMAAGWQMARGKDFPTLPKAMQNARLQGKSWQLILRLCQKTLRFCRRFSRPRLQQWVMGKSGDQLVGWLMLIGGFLLAIPTANIPLNNTFPALMILFAAIAWLERDGVMIFISLAWGVVTLVYFVVIGVVLWLFGAQVAAWLHSLWH